MSSVFHRSPGHRYPVAVKARGMYITDAAGREYLDMSGGAAVSGLGHGHPDILAALHAQLDQLAFAHTAFFTNEPQEYLAARLAGRFGDPAARSYFTSGGSEANETALKLAWQYHQARGQGQRKVVISREHSYHGNTFATLSVSGHPGRRKASAAPLLDWPRIAPCYALRNQRADESLDDYALRAANELELAIERVGAENVSAFICEPVVGSALGAVAAAPGYLRRIREICDRHGVLWIADEIMCGSGRTGTWFAHEHDGVKPDIVTLAKGIAGGYLPLAATVIAGPVAQVMEQAGFVHGHTYVGHAAACAVGGAVQRVVDRDGLLQRAQAIGGELGGLLNEHFGSHPNVADIRGRGAFWALELVADRDSMAGFSGQAGLEVRLRNAALAQGMVCYPGSISVDGATVPHILLAPPLIAQPVHFEQCAERLAATLREVLGA
jgi:adenosylmethionine-8-amino-7-oxononanoate aminotransferase